MMSDLNPGLILIAVACVLPLLPHMIRNAVSVATPLITLALLFQTPFGTGGPLDFFDLALVTNRIDATAFVFSGIFLAAAALASVYSAHVDSRLQSSAALAYAGAAVGAVCAGDLVTMFVFWELTAITSVFLIWAQRTDHAFDTGMRYLIVQIGSGVILLAGVLIHIHATGSAAFNTIADIDIATMDQVSLGAWLILIGIGIKAAFPLLNNWLHDAYPAATHTGSVWLSVFTTKLAIYALMRGFPGSDVLLIIGSVMVVLPILYATFENDLRRVLTYALNNQLGFMVIAIGIGSELALAGATAHAVCHILYKSLLFMSIGAVIWQTGTAKASDLGGLARHMPIAAAACAFGALAMSTPGLAGYVSKSLITSAAGKAEAFWPYIALMFGSAGVFLVSGLKLTWDAFLAPAQRNHDHVRDVAPNMTVAMGLTAALLLVFGLAPSLLFAQLPSPVTYDPYTLDHIVTQLQMLAVTALVFALALSRCWLPTPQALVTLDTDWLYRKFGYNIAGTLLLMAADIWRFICNAGEAAINGVERNLSRAHNPDGILGRTWSTGTMAFVATAMLAVYLLLFYYRDVTAPL